MASLYELRRRLARFYLSTISEVETRYRRGEKVLVPFSSSRDGDWDQIKYSLQWVIENREQDATALDLATNYPYQAPNILNALQSPDQRIKLLEVASETAHQMGNVAAEAVHLGNIAITLRNTGRIRDAILYLEQLLQMVSGRDDQEEANVLTILGECYRTVNRYSEAITVLELALTVAADKLYTLKSLTYHNLGITYRNVGDVSRSIEYHEQERIIAQEEQEIAGVIRANMSLGIAYFEQLELEQALQYYLEANTAVELQAFKQNIQSSYYYCVQDGTDKPVLRYGVSSENWQKFVRIPVLANRGVAEASAGRYEAALSFLQQALATTQETGHRRFAAIWKQKEGTIYYALGAYEQALQCYDESLEIAQSISAPRAIGFARAGLGKTKLALAYAGAAQAQPGSPDLEAAFELASQEGGRNPRDLQEWGADLVEAHLFEQNIDAAWQIVDHIREYAVIENRYRVLLLIGITQALRECDRETIRLSFAEAYQEACLMLAKSPEHVAARYASGLAVSGLALFVADDEREQQISLAYATFREALERCTAKGVVLDALRLFEIIRSLDPVDALYHVHTLIDETIRSA
jgi:tetratricopeptide (TPR) repeat protein